jgi:type 1 glutamine amidotransferase
MTTVVFLAGEGEYESDRTMRAIADDYRKHLGVDVVYKTPDTLVDMGVFPPSSFGDLSALADADLLVVYTRWRQLPDAEMQAIVEYIEKGGNIIGVRTSTHAFHYPEDSQWSKWNDRFGRDVLGSPWIRHHGHSSSTDVSWYRESGHPILEGVPREFHSASWLYTTDLLPDAEPILWGVPVDPENEPVPAAFAWVRENGDQRIVYTNMGHQADFDDPITHTFFLNAARWALHQI